MVVEVGWVSTDSAALAFTQPRLVPLTLTAGFYRLGREFAAPTEGRIGGVGFAYFSD